MQGRFSVFMFVVVLLVACAPPTPTDSAAVTATSPDPPLASATTPVTRTPVAREEETGIAAVDSVIEEMLGNDLEQRMSLVRLVTSGCTTVDGLGGPPKCAEGQEEGALVEYLPLGGPGEGSPVLSAEVAGVLAFEVESLYAVYRIADDLPNEPEYPRGTYVLFFRTAGGDTGSETRIVRVDDTGAIVRLDSIGMMPVDLFFQQMVADLLDSPPESSMFSSEAAEILLYPPEM